MKIVFTGGNTRGEVFSIVALIDEIRAVYNSIKITPGLNKKDLKIFYVGCLQDFNTQIFLNKNVILKDIYINEEGETILGAIFDIFIKIPFGLPFTFFQSLFHLIKINPNIIFTKGGHDSVPVTIAAWVLKIPIFVHESNAIPTRGNYLIRKLATRIFTSYSKTKDLFCASKHLKIKNLLQAKILFSGVPIRSQIIEASLLKMSKTAIRESFNLNSQRPIILFLNESSPAIEDEKINDLILHILPELLTEFEIIHQSGHKHYSNIQKESAIFLPEEVKKYYHLYPFFDKQILSHAYFLADLIVTRGGASTIFEMAMFGKASIIVPLFHAKSRYQITNAFLYSYERAEACLVVEEANFLPYFLRGTIKELFNNQKKMEEMAKNSKQFSQPEATKIIIQDIFNFFGKR